MASSPSFGALAAHIDEDRLWRDHMALARHGETGRGGVNRQALSSEEIAARATLVEWAKASGFEAANDAIGNLFLRLPGRDPSAAPVLAGSHIDTQPTGGKFDGAYGVLAGIEALRAMVAAGYVPPRPIEVVAWMNEEGSRFAPGMMGSEAFAGIRPLDQMLGVADGKGVSVAAALTEVLGAELELPRRPLGFPVAAYVEAHIEQGPILELEGRTIGVVTGIQGKRTFRVIVTGEEAHAGTTPRRIRKDALSAAVAMVAALESVIHDAEDVVKFTIGSFTVAPNAPSVVPARVQFSVDLRHPDRATLQALGDRVATICAERRGPCAVETKELVTAAPLDFPAAMQDVIRRAANGLGLPQMDIYSAAGHDSRNLHAVCPAGMIFVPCAKGISHNEAESATAADLAAGARVLVEVLRELAERDGEYV